MRPNARRGWESDIGNSTFVGSPSPLAGTVINLDPIDSVEQKEGPGFLRGLLFIVTV